jgi:membrane-bound lytic murein transglycosylase D
MVAFSLVGCTPTTPTGAPEGAQRQATAPELAPAASSPQAASSAASGLTREQQQTRLLIAQVEKAYAQGEANYHKGRLAEAKDKFDLAVDLMLTSDIDIRSNAELQEEFDRIVDGVNALETEALKQGNGFVPKEEPAPAEVASDVTFNVDPNFVAKAKADLATTKSDLPLMVNDYVAAFINFFANTQRGHNTLLHSFQRAGRYKSMIQRVMAEEGVPQDLIYLAVAESGFNPRALNRGSGAGGMWQFMPHGNYGLTRNAYVDERFDPEKSTRAYARYMKFIHDQTGDWYLSMAGYDWGTGNVQRAVQKTGYADFWELYKRNNLPAETKNYVPEILAAIIIANHPTQYGFDDVTLDAPVLTDTVTINYQVDLRLVSDMVGAPTGELQALNPSLLRMTTPPDTAFDLHLPAGTAMLFEKRIAAIPEGKRNGWRYHRVVAGDTLASVAHSYRVTAADLAAANQLNEGDDIAKLEALVVPASPAASPSAPPSRSLLYAARKGETLVTISDRFGVSLTQLRHWNHLNGTKVRPGQRLHVTDPSSTPRASVSGHRRRGSHADSDDSRAQADTTKAAPAKGTETTSKSATKQSKKQSKSATKHSRNAKEKPESTDKDSAAPGKRNRKSRASAAEKEPAQSAADTSGAKNKGKSSARKSHTRKRAAK